MSEEKDKFEWQYKGDKTKIFPIDYTLKEMAGTIGIDPRTFQSCISQSPVFREILLELLVSDDTKEIPDDFKKDKYPLPLELGLFLSELGKLVSDNSTYKGIMAGTKKTSTEEEQEFVKRLCQDLCDAISDANDTPEKEFYRHTLMSNVDCILSS